MSLLLPHKPPRFYLARHFAMLARGDVSWNSFDEAPKQVQEFVICMQGVEKAGDLDLSAQVCLRQWFGVAWMVELNIVVWVC